MYSRFRFPIWAPDYVCVTVELKPELDCIAKTARNAKNVWCWRKKLLGTEFCASQIFQVCFSHQVYRTSTDVTWLLQLDPELQVLMSGLLPLTLSLGRILFSSDISLLWPLPTFSFSMRKYIVCHCILEWKYRCR